MWWQARKAKALKFWLSMGRHVAHLRAESQGFRALVLSMPPHQQFHCSRNTCVCVQHVFAYSEKKAPKGLCSLERRPTMNDLAQVFGGVVVVSHERHDGAIQSMNPPKQAPEVQAVRIRGDLP